MTEVTALSSVNDILDTDLVMVTHSDGGGFKISGADLKNVMKAQAVDTVALNNMNSVTSNAVFGIKVKSKIVNVAFTASEKIIDLGTSNAIAVFPYTGAEGVYAKINSYITTEQKYSLSLSPDNGYTYSLIVYYI